MNTPGEDRDDEDTLEVTCPLDGHEAVIEVRYGDADREWCEVVRCSRFGNEPPVGCGQKCLQPC